MTTTGTAKPSKAQTRDLRNMAHNEAHGFFTRHHEMHQHTMAALYARNWVEDVVGPTRGRLVRLTDAGRKLVAD